MRTFFYIFFVIAIVACKGKVQHSKAVNTFKDTTKTAVDKTIPTAKVTGDTIFKPFKLVEDFMVADTGYFDFAIGNGTYAVIKKDGKLIDTIDYTYKFQPVDSSLFAYYKIEGQGPLSKEIAPNPIKKSMSANIGDYIVIQSTGKKINVSKLAPDFGWFASPSIISGFVYYWQVNKSNQQYRVSAARFDPKTGKTKSLYLFNDYIETDDGGYFQQAESEKGSVIFTSPTGKEYAFSPDFKLIK